MATSLYKAQEALRTCDEHKNEELSCFCKTCKKFICTKCAKTTCNGHDWDFIPLVAKKRRKETPELCRNIKKEHMPRCRKKLRVLDDKISAVEKASDEDVKKLEDGRIAMIGVINKMFDEKKRKREEFREVESTKMKEKRYKIKTKIEYLDKMTSSLDTNISAYSDYDVIEMEQEMLAALREIESYNVNVMATVATFVPGEINEEAIEEMIGAIEETTMVHVEEIKTFKPFDSIIYTIAPISCIQAWICDNKRDSIKQLSSQSTDTKSVTLSPRFDFITLSNGDFIVTNHNQQGIKRVTADGKVSDIINTKPLHSTVISKTHTNDMLVILVDENGFQFDLQPSSRRLVQKMTLSGKVLNTYEFQGDGKTRLFTLPWKTTENLNSNICVINSTSNDTGELVVLHDDGSLRFTYHGRDASVFTPFEVACDSERRIIVSEIDKNSLHVLRADGTFLGYLLSDMFEHPVKMAIYENNLWIGFRDGTVKVYEYTE